MISTLVQIVVDGDPEGEREDLSDIQVGGASHKKSTNVGVELGVVEADIHIGDKNNPACYYLIVKA